MKNLRNYAINQPDNGITKSIHDNAMSFTGLKPPNNATYIGQRESMDNIFYYYKDDKGNCWFDTARGREFEKKIQAAQKFKKSYKKSWSN